MKLLNTTEVYRVDEEPEAKALINTIKTEGLTKGYSIKSYSISYKEKRAKGEVVDKGYLVKVTKEYSDSFWEI